MVQWLRLCTSNAGAWFPSLVRELDLTDVNWRFRVLQWRPGEVDQRCSVLSDSLWPHGLHSPWTSPGQNTGVGSHSLLQGIFPTRGSNSGLPHCRWILYQLSHKGSHECILKYFIIKRKSCTGDCAWANSERINNLHKQVAQKPKVPNSCYSAYFLSTWTH